MDQRMFVVRTISILADNAGVRRIPRQRSGKYLDEARLGLVRAGETRIFQRVQKKQFHEYRVALLMDCSGSMGSGTNSKLDIACKCTHALEYALVKAGAKVDVYTFNGEFLALKPVEVQDPDKLYALANASRGRYGADNNDADAVRIVTKKMLAAPEPGKILLVLSDGQPAPGNGPITKLIKSGNRADSQKDLINAVTEARNHGLVCLAVGVETAEPLRYYGKHHTAVVHDLNELYSSMAKMLEQNIQRG